MQTLHRELGALRGAELAGEDLQQCGFARAAFTGQGNPAGLGDGHGDAVEGENGGACTPGVLESRLSRSQDLLFAALDPVEGSG
eukprot:CAMPEP_0115730172 /NCGR_PEP_ID=MMETSP0272-20121206/83899_1 /TAXON_ID=71861 /ORGANISM="Scrippsiella trochoidea, Strain CCMP3099" /LENGTH=83 /DNA_ID=CAMNT_0003173903 /DNA_START=116 /DNA_END=364 /DNA_ORIENTATION=+